ncbi:MAG: HAD family phosphatase [Verrucomicrobia bacterium]|nr:HAD family phosphatase [Verrucomicrobiota bacterium]
MKHDPALPGVDPALLERIEAVIFDMDGVLVDSEPLHRAAFLDVFAELGHADDHGVRFENFYGRSDRAVWEDFLGRHRAPWPIERLMEEKEARFLERLRRERPVFPEIPSLAAELAKRRRLAVASSSPRKIIETVLDMAGLRPFFQTYAGAEDVRRLKPDPEIFLLAAERLGVPPRACAVVEDSPAGIEAANRAGMLSLGVATSLPPERLSKAAYAARSHAEIRDLLLERDSK